MENELKVEKKTIKGFFQAHKAEIAPIAILVGFIGLTATCLYLGTKPVVVDVAVKAEGAIEDGYDIWALVNGMDEKLVEFAPTLQKFVEDNGFTIMCDVI